MTPQEILKVEENIVEALKTVYDPEIPVNVYDLGIIYDIEVLSSGETNIVMTLTAPNCPMADEVMQMIKDATQSVEGVSKANVELVFEPQWDRSMISDEALLELGLL
ncbi:MAG: DUF59 domain-containing protein [Bacteroidetes bacterium]|nr:DUF59 domain-containing protein [Bacteroidota bacterium]